MCLFPRFGCICCLHLQGYLIAFRSTADHNVVFHSETGGSILLRNVSSHLIDTPRHNPEGYRLAPGSNPGQSTWNCLMDKWHWDRSLSEHLSHSSHYHPNNAPHKIVHLPQTIHKVKDKGKVHPRIGHEDPEGSRGITLLFL
jgi:hypothetical protein